MSKDHRSWRHFKKTFFILVEGETEEWYVALLKKEENLYRSKNIKLRIEILRDKEPNKVEQKLAEIYNQKSYDSIIWIVDLDQILNSTKLKEAYEALKNKLSKDKKKIKIIKILENNPCFELWIVLHYTYTTRNYSTCNSVEKSVKKYIPEYSKTRKFYNNDKNNIYSMLKPNQNTAIYNARKLQEEYEKGYTESKSEMFIFLKLLGLY